MADAHRNFAYSTVKGTNQGDTSNPGTGTTLTVQNGDGLKFPPVPFNATVWPTATQPLSTNAEVIRVTDIDGDTMTIVRQQESSSSRSVIVGDQIAATITNKTLTDAEAPLTYWAPVHIAGVGQTGLQTMGNTAVASNNSMFVFPVTVAPGLQFNQILIGNSLSMVTSTVAASHTYSSLFGIYSMNGNTALNLISSNSFEIEESMSSRSLTWNWPTTTATSGYGYGTGFAGAAVTGTQQQASYISGTRIIGLQFGGNMTLTGGVYYLGFLSFRSTANSRSTYGLSLAGIVGQPLHPINRVAGSLMPIGSASSDWQANNANQTAWFGRNIVGLITRTALYGGNAIPSTIALTELGTTGGAGSTASILPAVTFVST